MATDTPTNTREGIAPDTTYGNYSRPGDARRALAEHQKTHPSARGLGHGLAGHKEAEVERMRNLASRVRGKQ